MTMKQKKAVRRNLEKARVALAEKRALVKARPPIIASNIPRDEDQRSVAEWQRDMAAAKGYLDAPAPTNRNPLDASERNLQILTQQVLALRVTMKGLL